MEQPTIANSSILRYEREVYKESMLRDPLYPSHLTIPESTFDTPSGIVNLFHSNVKRAHYSNIDPRDIMLGILFVALSLVFYIMVK